MAEERFTFGIGYEEGMAWDAYLRVVQANREGSRLTGCRVPTLLLAAEVDGQLVGRVTLRWELDDVLASEGGHIGFAVLPPSRRRGHATEMLRQSAVLARSMGIARVLVTCDEDNLGSAAVIERCGGAYESNVITVDGPVRRYWIE
jgi:predicted acetyltransferase